MKNRPTASTVPIISEEKFCFTVGKRLPGGDGIFLQKSSRGEIFIGSGKYAVLRITPAERYSIKTVYDGSSLTAEFSKGRLRYSEDGGEAVCIFRVIADKNVLSVSISSMFRIDLNISRGTAEAQSPEKGICVIKTELGASLLAAYAGKTEFSDDMGKLRIGAGRSKLVLSIISDGDDADPVISRMKTAVRTRTPIKKNSSPKTDVYYYRKSADDYEYPLNILLDFLRSRLLSVISDDGELFLSCGKGAGIGVERYASRSLYSLAEEFRFAIADKNGYASETYLDYFFSLYEKYGELPCYIGAGGNEPVFIKGLYCNGFSVLALTLADYIRVFRENGGDKAKTLLKYLINRGMLLEKGGMLPFSGFEEDIPSEMRFYGSYYGSMGFCLAAEEYLKLIPPDSAERKRVFDCTKRIRSRLRDNFEINGLLNESSVGRNQIIRFPSRIYGRCDGCGRKSLLTRKIKPYLCDICAAGERPKITYRGEKRMDGNPVYRLSFLCDGYKLITEHWLMKYTVKEPCGFEETVGAAVYHRNDPERSWKYLISALEMSDTEGYDIAGLCRLTSVMLKTARRSSKNKENE